MGSKTIAHKVHAHAHTYARAHAHVHARVHAHAHAHGLETCLEALRTHRRSLYIRPDCGVQWCRAAVALLTMCVILAKWGPC